MPTFKPGDVVRVPFPYTDRPVRQWRPALVVAAGTLADRHGLLWVNMITSAENRRWPDDVDLEFARAGLPVPSVVRVANIATIEASDAGELGRVNDQELARVRVILAHMLGL